jgi:uncharacterized membrane protein
MPSPDNVSRFPTPRRSGGFNFRQPKAQVLGMYGLGIAAFFTLRWGGGLVDFLGIGLAVAAVAIAASKRDEPPAWAATHHEFGLRTLVIAGAAWVLFGLTKVLTITIPIVNLIEYVILLWLLVRSVVGSVRALDERRVEKPDSLLL